MPPRQQDANYNGGSLVLTAVLPDSGQFDSAKANLNAAWFSSFDTAAQQQSVFLTLPKFNLVGNTLSWKTTLQNLGMTILFGAHSSTQAALRGRCSGSICADARCRAGDIQGVAPIESDPTSATTTSKLTADVNFAWQGASNTTGTAIAGGQGARVRAGSPPAPFTANV